MSEFLALHNPNLSSLYIDELVSAYISESAGEDINHDIAFAQMCLETGYLKFGNLVTQDMNNFCGLGAISEKQPGEKFDTMELGVRAHIQHLKA
ncbi:MAG: glucosaminidase domain-containing protein, partial [Spirochaetaceae bacterium]|nr:glucosaminidase domain-containing protein [Spirochaetaceae bacterium]